MEKEKQAGGECNILRGGWCKTHGVKSRKVVHKIKKWDKLRSGLYGYVYNSKVTWCCTWEKDELGKKSDSARMVALNGYKVGTRVADFPCGPGGINRMMGTKRWREGDDKLPWIKNMDN